MVPFVYTSKINSSSMGSSISYKALVAEEVNGKVLPNLKTLNTDSLPSGDLLIKVLYSSLNYKDALSSHGNRGITKRYPHTPGIDAAGVVVESNVSNFSEGDNVIVTGYDLGMNTPGGFGGYIRVPAEWVVPQPEAISIQESMMLGTAGFTAAIAIYKMIMNGQHPSMGPVVVTGSTGGLGSLAVNILSKLGFEVISVTGKTDAHDYLMSIGSTSVISREEVDDKSNKLLISSRWSGGIDTVGGNILATLLKGCKRHGNISCCGNAASGSLETSVYPFILNGVNLLGIDSATTPMGLRLRLWEMLSKEWRPDALHLISKTIELNELPYYIDLILKGGVKGRTVIKHEHASLD